MLLGNCEKSTSSEVARLRATVDISGCLISLDCCLAIYQDFYHDFEMLPAYTDVVSHECRKYAQLKNEKSEGRSIETATKPDIGTRSLTLYMVDTVMHNNILFICPA